MPSPRRLLYREYGEELRVEEDGRLVLEVLCGGAFQFGVAFALNESERKDYEARGDAFIKELARSVLANPEAYEARG